MKIRSLIVALTASLVAPAAFGQSADVMTVVDESGSMATEHAWLPGMIAALDIGLNTAGVTSNQYSTTGYGTGGSNSISEPHPFVAGQGPHSHTVGAGPNNEWFDAGDYSNTTPSFTTAGGYEDGWDAIAFALGLGGQRGDAATNVILVTDEDRDFPSINDPYTYDGMLALLAANNALLNVVVNVSFTCEDGRSALGISGPAGSATGYVADGSGGYTTCANAVAAADSTYNTSTSDYVNLALASGGAAWDLNALRVNDADLAASFTAAFVDIKVKEIEEQELPEPGTLALLGLGLFGLGAARRRRTQ